MIILKHASIKIDTLDPNLWRGVTALESWLATLHDRALIITSSIRPDAKLHTTGQAVDIRVPSRSPSIAAVSRDPNGLRAILEAASNRSPDRRFDAAVFKQLRVGLLGAATGPFLNDWDFIHETFPDPANDHYHLEWHPKRPFIARL